MAAEMTREQWVAWYMALGLTREQAEDHLDSIEYATALAKSEADS